MLEHPPNARLFPAKENIMNRRQFLAATAGAVVAQTTRQVFAQSQRADGRPNILFCIADDWGFPHASICGDKVVKTPTFDRLAREGALFNHSYCAAPTCTASRGGILTGQAIHRLEAGANLWSALPSKFKVYPDLLEASGYTVGLKGKGWGPGNFKAGGWSRNPAGPAVAGFEQFLKNASKGKPFCFWFGSQDPHRTYEEGSGVRAGLKLDEVFVPPYLPDTAEVRSDILDYYFEVQRFDREVGEHLRLLEAAGQLDHTLVVMTSDNGWPFPRGKASLYDAGTHMPLAIRYPAKIKPGTVIDDFVSHTDFAPTFLELAGLDSLPDMTGRSLLSILAGTRTSDAAFTERERHANVRKGDLSYPARAINTKDFLYIRNFRPDRWPAGDPEKYFAVGAFGDIDGGPSKSQLLDQRSDPAFSKQFQLACAKRPAEELYDLVKDPYQLTNVAANPQYAQARSQLRVRLDKHLTDTADPRLQSDDDRFDHYEYFGNAG
jgi:arylsulfatase A-like enzyme